MARELISKATRNEFREVLTGFVLRDIEMMFEAGELHSKLYYDPCIVGHLRTLVERYYANIDFNDPEQIGNLLVTYGELLEKLAIPGSDLIQNQETAGRLMRR